MGFFLLITVMDNFTWDDTSGENNTEPDEDNFANMYHFAVNGVAQGLVGIAGLIGKLTNVPIIKVCFSESAMCLSNLQGVISNHYPGI